ncbi:MAG: hypothetical protein PHU51_05075 [Candidatus Nanoarchaeia archaeon]|nr:hypothetical protein [Candidatus Nanoarchaeia archaeon]
MDIRVRGYLDRAENQLIIAKATFELSVNDKAKEAVFIPLDKTFFNNVISESYYAIFYTAKAYLLSLGIETSAPEEHKKTYKQFKELVKNKKLDEELFKIYDEESNKAENLLKIFFDEKRNRGRFTYNLSANANKPFAEQSIKNSIFFVSNLKKIIEIE